MTKSSKTCLNKDILYLVEVKNWLLDYSYYKISVKTFHCVTLIIIIYAKMWDSLATKLFPFLLSIAMTMTMSIFEPLVKLEDLAF